MLDTKDAIIAIDAALRTDIRESITVTEFRFDFTRVESGGLSWSTSQVLDAIDAVGIESSGLVSYILVRSVGEVSARPLLQAIENTFSSTFILPSELVFDAIANELGVRHDRAIWRDVIATAEVISGYYDETRQLEITARTHEFDDQTVDFLPDPDELRERSIDAQMERDAGRLTLSNLPIAAASLEELADGEQKSGNASNNTLTGTDGNDLILGLAGNDTMEGLGDHDVLRGGSGQDSMLGGGGDDVLEGDAGADTLKGGEGNDTAIGGDDNDLLQGEDGDDQMAGGKGADTIEGGSGRDLIAGEDGGDSLAGGDRNDDLWGGGRADEMHGNSGNDRLFGGWGWDTMTGGSGSDTMRGEDGSDRMSGGSQADRLWGNKGNDTLEGGWQGDLLDAGMETTASTAGGVWTGLSDGRATTR